MLSDAMRLAVLMMVGDDQARNDALCAALKAKAEGAQGESTGAIAARTGLNRKMVERDLERFLRLWRYGAEVLDPPIAPEVVKLSLEE